MFAFGPPPIARAATPATGSVTWNRQPGDLRSPPAADLYDASNATISLDGTLEHATIAVNDPTTGQFYTFDFAPPAGQTLQPGVYQDAMRYPADVAGRPGIDVTADGGGCDTEYGNFVVKDVHADAAGDVDRLWLEYADSCENAAVPAEFGEIRLGEPPPTGPVAAEPAAIDWPATDVGRPSAVVPVTLAAGAGGAQINAASLSGSDAGDFTITGDRCSGVALPAGGRCVVRLQLDPTGSGERTADLVLTGTGGSVVDIPLSAFAHAGTTRMDVESDPGDQVGEGVNSFYTTADARIAATGTAQRVGVQVAVDGGTVWTATFEPGSGDVLTAGASYPGATRGSDGLGRPLLEVDGNGWACNSDVSEFKVLDLSFDADGDLRDFAASFVQHCDGDEPALRGTFQFRAPTPAGLLAVNTSPPAVSGDAAPGQTVDASTGVWNDNSPAFAYQWQRCTQTGCADIPGADGDTYAVGLDDVGEQLAVEVNLTNPAGLSAWYRSEPTPIVPPPPTPANLTPPSVTAAPEEGVAAQASAGTWTESPSAFAYQWSSCDAGGCDPVQGATDATYVPGAADVGRSLEVSVVASDGSASAPAVSPASQPVAAIPSPGPIATTPPSTNFPGPPLVPPPGAQTTAGVLAAPPANGAARASESTGPAQLRQTITVASRQPAATVRRRGLVVRVGCSAACTVTLSVTRTTSARRSVTIGRAEVKLEASARASLRVHLVAGSAGRVGLTSSARRTASPHTAAAPVHRAVTLTA